MTSSDRPALLLINSVSAGVDRADALADIESAGVWFAQVAAAHPCAELGGDLRVDVDRLDDLRLVRGAVEQVLLTGRPRGSSLAVINRCDNESAPSWALDLDSDGRLLVRRRVWGSGVESWLGLVASDAIDIVRSGAQGLIATCATPSCPIVFLPEHHRRRYCSAECAHRTRQARYELARTVGDAS